jgi:hypothetical protein
MEKKYIYDIAGMLVVQSGKDIKIYNDAIDCIRERDAQISALEAYKANNYDPAESIRLNGEVMEMKERLAARITECEKLLKEKIEYQEGCEELTAEIARLREALEHYANQGVKFIFPDGKEWTVPFIGPAIAQTALRPAGQTEGGGE